MNRKRWLLPFVALALFSVASALADEHTFDGSTDGNMNTAANWTPEAVPEAGDTAILGLNRDIDSGTLACPATLAGDGTYDINAGTFSKLVTVTADAEWKHILAGTFTEGITVADGGRVLGNTAVVFADASTLTVNGYYYVYHATADAGTVAGSIIIGSTGTLGFMANSLTLAHTNTTAGPVLGGAGAVIGNPNAYTGCVINVEKPITGTGTINWAGGMDIEGGINGTAITHAGLSAGTNTLTVDVGGTTLNLGGAATALDVLVTNTSGTVTLGDGMTVRSFKVNGSGGTVDYASKTITINGASGVECLAWTAGTTSNAGTFDIAASCSGKWNNSVCPALVIDAGVTFTLSGTTCMRAFNIAGTIATGGSALKPIPSANDFWTQTGDVTSTGSQLGITPGAATSNAGSIVISGTKDVVIDAGSNATLMLGGLTVGTGALTIYGSTGVWRGLTVTGPLVCGNVTLGSTTTTKGGRLTLGTTATMGTLAKSTGSTATTHQLVLGSARVTAKGFWALDGVTVNFGRAAIFADASTTINGSGATVTNTAADLFSNGSGKVLTVSNVGATTPGLRIWCGSTDGGGNNAAHKFFPGTPSAAALMGCGN